MDSKEVTTYNIKAPNKNIEVLKNQFPHCFTKDGEFDIEKFRTELSETEVDFYKESYGIDWLGKSYARLLASDEATTLLKEDDEHNQKTENKDSQNLLIKGDNLEVLKHLSNSYYEKIKMIYIDPPYNTGSDGFVYKDDRKFTIEELKHLAGVNEEKAKRILEFTKSKSNSHSAWLTFMYPRLYIAKQLLKEDGVIFVSIDDNEVAQLRLLMDEIFGEENFIGELIWKSRQNKDNRNISGLSIDHEYVLCFSKTNSERRLKGAERKTEQYSNPDNDERGVWVSGNMVGLLSENLRPNCHYELINPETGINYGKPKMGWRYEKKSMNRLITDNRIIWPKSPDGRPRKKVFLNEISDELPNYTSIIGENVFTRNGTKEIDDLFGEKYFDFPKPTALISKLINQVCVNSDEDIVLDFFAGSGTTADAVMQLNQEDGGNRKFILVQLPEVIESKKNSITYEFVKNELNIDIPTIFDITKERIVRSAKKIIDSNIDIAARTVKIKCEGINEEHCPACKGEHSIKVEAKKARDLSIQDLGFKIFETTPIWEDFNFDANEINELQKLVEVSSLTKDDIKTLLITWKTNDGLVLTKGLTETKLDKYLAYYGEGKLYLMNSGFTTDSLKALLEKIDSDKNFNPTSIISFGYMFESKNLREIAENIKSYANKKNIDIDFITRY